MHMSRWICLNKQSEEESGLNHFLMIKNDFYVLLKHVVTESRAE